MIGTDLWPAPVQFIPPGNRDKELYMIPPILQFKFTNLEVTVFHAFLVTLNTYGREWVCQSAAVRTR